MLQPFHPRASRRTAALLLAAISTSALAQTNAAAPPSNAVPPPAPTARQSRSAEDAFLAGAYYLDKRNLLGAEQEFVKAVKLSPANSTYLQALALTREHRLSDLVQQAGKARILGQDHRADLLLAEARAIDPKNAIITQHFVPDAIPSLTTHIDDSPDPDRNNSLATLTGPIVLQPSPAPENFHIRADTQEAVRQVASAYGLRASFDDTAPHQQIRFDLDNAHYATAMPILLQMTHLFSVPLDAHSILLATDTPENRQRLERQVQETVSIPGLTPDQLGEVRTVVQNVFDLKQVTTQNGSSTIVLRAPASLIQPINLVLADLIDGGAQVMIDVKLYAVDTSRITNIGLTAPQQVGIYNVESSAQNLVQQNQTLVNQAIAQGLIPANASFATIALYLIASGLVQSALLSSTLGFFGGGLTLTGVTANNPLNFNLALNTSDTRALDDIQVRVGDKQTATFRVGSRYPITTSTLSSGLSSTTSNALAGVKINGVSASSLLSQYLGNNSQTIPMIQYEDLGVTFKAVPVVQKSGDIALHLDLKIEALTGGSNDNIPILASRQFASDITVADGTTALLASSVTKSEANAISGYPGIGELPGFQQSLSDTNANNTSSEILLLVTPHVVRRRSPVLATAPILVDLPTKPE